VCKEEEEEDEEDEEEARPLGSRGGNCKHWKISRLLPTA